MAQPLLSFAAAQPAHQSELLLLRLVCLESPGEGKTGGERKSAGKG